MNQFEYPITELNLSDSSSTGLFDVCERKFEFFKVWDFSGLYDDNNQAALVGHAMHKAYQTYLDTENLDRALWILTREYPIDLAPDENDLRGFEASISTLVKLCQTPQLVKYQLSDINCSDSITRPAIEVPFRIKIKNFNLSTSTDRYVPVYYNGLIDGVVYDTVTGEYIVIDLKTHRQNLHDTSALYYYREQPIPYALVLEHILGHEIESLRVIFISCYIDILNPKIQIHDLRKSKEDIDDWVRTFYDRLTRMKKFYNIGWWPRRGQSCISWNKKCPMFDACSSRNPHFISNLRRLVAKENEGKGWQRPEPWISFDLEVKEAV